MRVLTIVVSNPCVTDNWRQDWLPGHVHKTCVFLEFLELYNVFRFDGLRHRIIKTDNQL